MAAAAPRCKAHTGFDTQGYLMKTAMASRKTMNQMRAAEAGAEVVVLQPQRARTAASGRWALPQPRSNRRGWESHSGGSVLPPPGVECHMCYRS